MSVLWVTAFRDLQRETWNMSPRPFEEYLRGFAPLVTLSPHLVCFADEPHASIIREKTGLEKILPYDVEDTFIPKYTARQKEIIESDEFKKKIPAIVWPGFVYPEWGTVNYSKVCFVRRASTLFPGYTHYAWIDFGFVKKSDEAPPPTFIPRLLPDKIMVRSYRRFHIDDEGNPMLGDIFSTEKKYEHHPWNNPDFMLKHMYYGIHANIWVVPVHLVEWFEHSFERSIQMHLERGIANHDEPVWLPIVYEFPKRFHIDVKNGVYNSWTWLQQHKHKILWVTAFKDFGRETWSVGQRSVSTYLEAFERIKHLDLVCFTDDPRVQYHRTYPFEEDDTFFGKKDLYYRHKKILESSEFWEKCPIDRKADAPEYTYPEYSLMCFSKTSFVRRASTMFPEYTHYAWIDFGFAKTPDACIPTFQNAPADQVYISSCRMLTFSPDNEPAYGEWGSTDPGRANPKHNWNNPQLIVKYQHWNVQANSYLVPKHMTHWLERQMEYAVDRHYECGIVGHDEPVFHAIIHDFPKRVRLNIKTDWTGAWP
mgnify:CR=1 FL=1